MRIIQEIKSQIRWFSSGVKNLIRWFPVIWNDRDWSEAFIYFLLHKKLDHMEQFYRSVNTMTERASETAHEIKIAKDTLKRLIDDNYLNEELEEYYRTYGEDDKLMSFEPVEGKSYSKLVWTEDEQQMKMFRDSGDKADKREQEDLDFLFKYLREHIEGWWD